MRRAVEARLETQTAQYRLGERASGAFSLCSRDVYDG